MRKDSDMTNADGFIKTLAELLQEDHSALTLETKIVDLPNWDSLTILEFIALADEEYGAEIEIGRLSECVSVADLSKLTEDSKQESKAA